MASGTLELVFAIIYGIACVSLFFLSFLTQFFWRRKSTDVTLVILFYLFIIITGLELISSIELILPLWLPRFASLFHLFHMLAILLLVPALIFTSTKGLIDLVYVGEHATLKVIPIVRIAMVFLFVFSGVVEVSVMVAFAIGKILSQGDEAVHVFNIIVRNLSVLGILVQVIILSLCLSVTGITHYLRATWKEAEFVEQQAQYFTFLIASLCACLYTLFHIILRGIFTFSSWEYYGMLDRGLLIVCIVPIFVTLVWAAWRTFKDQELNYGAQIDDPNAVDAEIAEEKPEPTTQNKAATTTDDNVVTVTL